MRHACIHFSEQLRQRVAEGHRWDVIVCTDMLNLAEFRGMAVREIRELPTVVYFHENQFAYPCRAGYRRDEHFPFTNFTSALAADHIWFNSQFNFDSMIDGLGRQSERWPDYQPVEAIDALVEKLAIQPPGISSPPVDTHVYCQRRKQRLQIGEPMHLVWAARWEHDKNAEDLLDALNELTRASIPFRLSVLGQSFRYSPPVFDEIRETFADHIIRWGYQESREDYWTALAEADVFVSTANHEFFGLSAAESIAAGLYPIFPDRLAYPELLGVAMPTDKTGPFLYDGSAAGLADSLSDYHRQRAAGPLEFDLSLASAMLAAVAWENRVGSLDDGLTAFAD